MNNWPTILGIAAGIATIALLYILTMLGYYFLRKKFSTTKALVEIVIVAAALLLSIVVKFCVFLTEADGSFADAFATALAAIYAGVGGLTFEGLADAATAGSLLSCLYTGSSVYAGLIALSVISARASYELYSNIKLLFLRGCARRGRDIYLFTAATKDSLLLADSIREQSLKNRKKCVILFYGEDLNAFDRHDMICREIMSRGYLYISRMSSNTKKSRSALALLVCGASNDFGNAEKRRPKPFRVCFFAMATGKTLTGGEADNGAAMFAEIENLCRRNRKRGIRWVTDFYILTSSTPDHKYFEREIKKIVNTYFGGKKERADAAVRAFQAHPLNEAMLCAGDLADMRNRELSADPFGLFAPEQGEDSAQYRVTVVGFGRSGEEALGTIYTDCVQMKKDGTPVPFRADIYDLNVKELAGTFAAAHPLFMCIQSDKIGESKSERQQIDAERARILQFYSDLLSPADPNGDELLREMGFPLAVFHRASCFGMEFLRFLDEESGTENFGQLSRSNAFVLTLGDDEKDVMIANLLLQDLRREFDDAARRDPDRRTRSFPQAMYVHLRERKNYARLSWSAEDEARFPFFKVIPFGCRENVYSFERIVDDRDDMLYNYAYSILYDGKNGRFSALRNCFHDEETADFSRTLRKVSDEIFESAKNVRALRSAWLNADSFSKESNRAAERFRPRYVSALRQSRTNGMVRKLSLAEHLRWCRFHICRGWTFASYSHYDKAQKNLHRPIREHDCLCPYSTLPEDILVNDLSNVALAYSDLIEKKE